MVIIHTFYPEIPTHGMLAKFPWQLLMSRQAVLNQTKHAIVTESWRYWKAALPVVFPISLPASLKLPGCPPGRALGASSQLKMHQWKVWLSPHYKIYNFRLSWPPRYYSTWLEFARRCFRFARSSLRPHIPLLAFGGPLSLLPSSPLSFQLCFTLSWLVRRGRSLWGRHRNWSRCCWRSWGRHDRLH